MSVLPKGGDQWQHQNRTRYSIWGVSSPNPKPQSDLRPWGPKKIRAIVNRQRCAIPATWEADLSPVWLVLNPWQPTEFWVQRFDGSFVQVACVAYFYPGRRMWVRSLENFLSWKNGRPRFQKIRQPDS